MAEAGAPERFEDVVATMIPIADDQPDTPAHSGVTFAVDTPTPRPRRPPSSAETFDAPWVRMTVIGDPQGATFIASKFVPENKDLGSQADAAVGSG